MSLQLKSLISFSPPNSESKIKPWNEYVILPNQICSIGTEVQGGERGDEEERQSGKGLIKASGRVRQ